MGIVLQNNIIYYQNYTKSTLHQPRLWYVPEIVFGQFDTYISISISY